jgi:3'-phosphoadenosine 5'-phosphosulfate sulfotransferase (PAPS reductase)/FAD synthetase
MTLQRIRQAVEKYGQSGLYVSFSGGKDSTVLLHLVRSIYPNIKAVFCDTGLEFPEVKTFVKSIDNVEIIRPSMIFPEVIKKYGYPVTTKEQAHFIEQMQSNPTEALKRKLIEGIDKHGRKTKYVLSKCWYPFINSQFKVSDQCCFIMKKMPFHKYEARMGQIPFIGYVGGDSIARDHNYLKTGCNAFDLTRPHSRPLSFWTEQDIWDYIWAFSVRYTAVYDMGYDRTGCIFCMFGAHLEGEPNRFQLLAKTHPNQYNYCINGGSYYGDESGYTEKKGKKIIHREQPIWMPDKNGLGLGKVLEFINVPYKIYGGQFISEYRKGSGGMHEQIKMILP